MSMYNFIDVNGDSEGNVLPSEAMQINGEYIENMIPGYRTLHVSGREALSPELSSFETGVRDGAKLKSKRYPPRTIVVTYQLIAGTNESFREAYNKLGSILDVEDSELIFNDEQDKFYKGTPSVIGEIKPGSNAVVGEIKIVCNDPFKYSVVEYEATKNLDDSSILIDYNGTYKAYPTLEADFYSESEASEDGETSNALTGNGDCGYVAFFNEDEKIIQLGDPDEADGENTHPKSQTLISHVLTHSGAWGPSVNSLWALNSGAALPVAVNPMGAVSMGPCTYTVSGALPSTSGTLLNVWSKLDEPKMYYSVVGRTSGRTAESVKVTVSVTASLKYDGSYFGRGWSLTAWIFMGGTWYAETLKSINDYWRGRTAHTVNISFTVSSLAAETAALTGIKFRVTSGGASGSAGVVAETACNNLPISQYIADAPDDYFLTPSSYGTSSGYWHGPTITRNIPADAAGDVGASNFRLTYIPQVYIGTGKSDVNQMGAFQVALSNADGKIIAGMRLHKNTRGTTASVNFYVNGTRTGGAVINLTSRNPFTGVNCCASEISKQGNRVSFNVGELNRTYYDGQLFSAVVKKVTFAFEQYSSYPKLYHNGLYYIKFVKDNCDTWKNVPNKFGANDVVEADCRNGKVLLNGVPSPDLGALGNDWEEFCLTPGLNQIGVSYSGWVEEEYAPTFKVRYREVFL